MYSMATNQKTPIPALLFDLGADSPIASPVLSKRRKLEPGSLGLNLPVQGSITSISSMSSDLDSPVQGFLTPERRFFDESFDSSNLSSAGESPGAGQLRRSPRKRFKKDELWRAIQPAYQYLMDEEIIETCKSTESDLSWDDDDLAINTKVSFTEFIQQYKELTDWLTTIQVVTQRQGMTSLSEKYLNQSYHEEMLQRSPRRKLFNDYAKQLIRRFPNMKEEINIRLAHLNNQWLALENAICPQDGMDADSMLRDLEMDLNDLRRWLHGVENTLLPLCIRQSWTQEMLEDKLKEHQALQRDIESHSKIVSAVLKLCERLHLERQDVTATNESEGLRIIAINLERRWHAIWLQSLEWQCRLEEAINKRKNPNVSPNSSGGWEVQYNSAIPLSVSPDHVHGIDDSDETNSSTDFFDEEGGSELNHNSDVLPFSEDEYEKFALDVYCQTEIFDDPETLVQKEIIDDIDLTPEELDKTIYIQEADGNGLKMWHSSERVTKSNSSSPTGDVETNQDSAEKDSPPCKMETTDVGYGSESHSNDEPDSGEKSGEDGCKTSACQTELVDVTTSEVQTQEVVFRKRLVSSEDGFTSVSGSMQTVLSSGAWRDSMTSAYDTSSNCSDHPGHDVVADRSSRPSSLFIPDAVSGDEALPNFKNINASPGEKFYKVTLMDEEQRQGVETCRKGPFELFDVVAKPPRDESVVIEVVPEDELAEPKELAHKPVNGIIRTDPTLTKNRVDILWTEIEHLRENGSQKPSKLLTALESNDLDMRSSYTQEWTERTTKWSGAFSALVESTESNSEMISQTQQYTSSDGSLHERWSSPDSIRRLVSQAESLVKDDDCYAQQRPKWRERKQRRRRKPRTLVSDSVTSEGSMPENCSDSCDASGENTESEGENSSAISDTDYQKNSFSSVPEEPCDQDTTESTLNNSSYTITHLTSPESEVVKLRSGHKQKFERPRSVTEMYEMSSRLDLSPFFASEGSIPRHPYSTISSQLSDGHQGRGSALRNSKCNTLPRTQKPKFRKLKRSRSESEQLSSTAMTHYYHSFSKENSPSRFSREGSTERILSNNSSSERTVGYSADALCVSSSNELPEQTMTGESTDDLGRHLYDLTAIAAEYVQSNGNISEETDENLNSTIESFSENAWDNYQDPYPTVSEDGNEEKLDDSHLQWEASTLSSTFEFDDDFQLPNRKKKISGYAADISRVEDSDSDLDDLHYVLEESMQQLKVAESGLSHHKKDVMDSGIYLQPQKYAEILATCQTNIKCLQKVFEALEQTDGGIYLGEDDIHTVQQTIVKWTEHRKLAIRRQEQSNQLCKIYQQMVGVKNCLDDVVDLMDINQYPDHFSVEQVIKLLQEKKLDLQQQKSNLESATDDIQTFSANNTEIKMNRFQEQILKLSRDWVGVNDRLGLKFSEFQSLLICWYDYNETHKELSYFLTKERKLLECLEMTLGIMEFTKLQHQEVVRDIKGMLKDFNMYEQKLTAMHRLSNEVLLICDNEKQLEIRAEVAMAGSELAELRKRCQNIMTKCIENYGDLLLDVGLDDDTDSGIGIHRRTESVMGIETIGAGAVSIEPEVYAATAATQTTYDVERGEPVKPKEGGYSLMKFLVRMALPFQLAILMFYGILCFFERDGQPGGLSFSPTLRYVRGPPPT